MSKRFGRWYHQYKLPLVSHVSVDDFKSAFYTHPEVFLIGNSPELKPHIHSSELIGLADGTVEMRDDGWDVPESGILIGASERLTISSQYRMSYVVCDPRGNPLELTSEPYGKGNSIASFTARDTIVVVQMLEDLRHGKKLYFAVIREYVLEDNDNSFAVHPHDILLIEYDNTRSAEIRNVPPCFLPALEAAHHKLQEMYRSGIVFCKSGLPLDAVLT